MQGYRGTRRRYDLSRKIARSRRSAFAAFVWKSAKYLTTKYRTRLYSIVIGRFGIRVTRSCLLCTCAGFGKVAGEFKSKWTQIRRGIFSDRVYPGNGLSLLTSRVDRRSLLTYISTDDLSPCPSDRIRHSIVNNSSLDVRANASNVYRNRNLFRNN